MKSLEDAVNDFITAKATNLVELHPEEYELGYSDYGYFNNGCGWASCGGETEYDDDRAFDDAQAEILETLDGYANNKPEHMDSDLLEEFVSIPQVNQLLKQVVLGKLQIVNEPATFTKEKANKFFAELEEMEARNA